MLVRARLTRRRLSSDSWSPAVTDGHPLSLWSRAVTLTRREVHWRFLLLELDSSRERRFKRQTLGFERRFAKPDVQPMLDHQLHCLRTERGIAHDIKPV